VGLGLGLGFLIGLTGVGGGALVAPTLYALLGLGYADSVEVSLLFSIFTKIFGAVEHVRQGTVLWRLTLLYGLTGIPGAVVGSWLVRRAGPGGEQVFPFVLVAVLVLVAAMLLLETGIRAIATWEKPLSPHIVTWRGVAVIGVFQLLVGVLLGVTSVGSGSLVILSMVYLFRMTAQQIVGSNIVIALIMVIPAGVTHALAAGVPWTLLALLLSGSLAGAVLGARVTVRVPEQALKLLIVALVLLAALATVLRAA
jgi:uncharacterized membrane protein YfcA